MFKINNTHEFILAPTITNIWFTWLIAVAYFVRGARTYQKFYMKNNWEYENGWEPLYYENGWEPLYHENGWEPLFHENGWEPLYYKIIQNKRKREFLKCLNVNTYVQTNFMKLLTTIDRQ